MHQSRPRDPPPQAFAPGRMAVAAHDDQVDAPLDGAVDQCVTYARRGGVDPHLAGHFLPLQPAPHRQQALQDRLLGDLAVAPPGAYPHPPRPLQQRHRIDHGPGRTMAVVPGDEHVLAHRIDGPVAGHDQGRAGVVQQHLLHQVLGLAVARLGLSHDHEVGAVRLVQDGRRGLSFMDIGFQRGDARAAAQGPETLDPARRVPDGVGPGRGDVVQVVGGRAQARGQVDEPGGRDADQMAAMARRQPCGEPGSPFAARAAIEDDQQGSIVHDGNGDGGWHAAPSNTILLCPKRELMPRNARSARVGKGSAWQARRPP